MGKIADLMERMVAAGATRGQVIDAVYRLETEMFLEDHSIPEPNTGCWLWLGAVDVKGYGRVSSRKGVPGLAHRLALSVNLGKAGIDGLLALHTCDQPGCVNPAHIYGGDYQQNTNDMIRRGRSAGGRGVAAVVKANKPTPAELIGDEAVALLASYGYGVLEAPSMRGEVEFNEVWAAYPHKVGKRYALACYKAAIKRGCKHGEILFGVHHYVATKPPDRPWLNLSTFLNQERWKDVPAPVKGKIKSLGESFIEAAMKERQGETLFSMEYDDAQVGTVDATRSPVRRLPER